MIRWASSVLEPVTLPFPACSSTQFGVYSSQSKRVKLIICHFPFSICHWLLVMALRRLKMNSATRDRKWKMTNRKSQMTNVRAS